MPRPKDAIVWNEDLVRALRAREEQCRQQGSQRQYVWRDGARLVEEVRSDIYSFRSGRIVGLPKSLTKTISEECRAIIEGRKPILPAGYVATTSEERLLIPDGNPYDNDPYLKKIKARGGAYAILLAFHHSDRQTLTKDQICRAAQPFCDEQMRESFHDGRQYGAWKSKDTLVRHGLLLQQGTSRYGENGWRSNGVWSWTLTDDGKQFIQALLKKFPQGSTKPSNFADPVLASPGLVSESSGNSSSFNPLELFSMPHPPYLMKRSPNNPPLARKKNRSVLTDKDEEEFRDWLATANPGEQRKFRVGKERRMRIHNLCQELVDQTPGLRLRHESAGEGNGRALFVTVVSKGDNFASMATLHASTRKLSSVLADDAPSLHAEGQSGYPTLKVEKKSPKRHVEPFSGRGNSLLDGESPSKRTCARSREAAANAADLRKALDESKREFRLPAPPKNPSKRKLSFEKRSETVLLEMEDDVKNPAASKVAARQKVLYDLDDSDVEDNSFVARKCKFAANQTIINLDDDDDEPLSKHTFKSAQAINRQRLLGEDEIIDLADSQECMVPSELARNCSRSQSLKGNNSMTEELDDSEDIIDLADSQESVAIICNPHFPQASASTNACEGSLTNDVLTILIDDRERLQNSAPRKLRTELTWQMKSGALKSVWPPMWAPPEVEELQLKYGDFAFVLDNGMSSERRLPLSVERKRVADLVQRSVKGDHWKQLQRMRDCCRHAFMLIEGDTRSTRQFTAFNSQNMEEWNPAYHRVDDEESLFRFIGRAILSSGAFKVLQAKDQQATCRAVGALGIMAVVSEQDQRSHDDAPTSTPTAASAQTSLYDRLVKAGIPWELSRRVADEIGSVKQLDLLYAECTSEACRSALLCPIISSIQLPGSTSSTEDWSDAIFRSYFSSFPDPAKGRQLLDEYKHLVENNAVMLSALHTERDHQAAIEAALSKSSTAQNRCHPRRVAIELTDGLLSCFEMPTEGSFYTLSVTEHNERKNPIQRLVMHTSSGDLMSYGLFIHVVPAKLLVARVQQAMTSNGNDFVRAARLAAEEIERECKAKELKPGLDRRVILFQGMMAACNAAASQAAYRPEVRVVMDMVLAELMLAHDAVVLQAVRQTSDLELIVRQLALACLHYHVLAREKQ